MENPAQLDPAIYQEAKSSTPSVLTQIRELSAGLQPSLLRSVGLIPEPDVIITDLKMAGMDGLEMARIISGHALSSKVIILTMYGDPIYVNQAREAGAHGCLLKGGDLSELVQAIRNVVAGQQYFSPGLVH